MRHEELAAGEGRKQYFIDEKTIYWSPTFGAYEVHGLIGKAYKDLNAEQGPLGFPLTDGEATFDGRVSYFQHGRIDWNQGVLKVAFHIPRINFR
jgi:uncharacterized protein with LGFP repeats